MLYLLLTAAMAGQPSRRPSDDDRGKELYQRHCVQCHGVRNRGDGPATAALKFEVPDLENETETRGAHVDSVMQGKNAMPGFSAVFNDADAVRVLKFMASLGGGRSLKPPQEQPPPAKAAQPKKKVAEPPPKPDEDDETDANDSDEG